MKGGRNSDIIWAGFSSHANGIRVPKDENNLILSDVMYLDSLGTLHLQGEEKKI